MLLLSKSFLGKRCFQVLYLSTSTFLFSFLFGSPPSPFSEISETETEEMAFFAHGLFIQEMRRQVMKLRVEGRVS